jgi:putative FmdB family regulatory protein
MPLYEYVCAKCNTAFEVKLTFEEFDRARPACPVCKSKKVKRQIGIVGTPPHGEPSGRLTREQVVSAINMTQAMTGTNSPDHSGHEHLNN